MLSQGYGYKNLVICRAGDYSLHTKWLYPAEYKNFDLAISYFGDKEGRYADECDFYEQVKGPKFLPLYNLIVNNMDFIQQYDAIWLSEDDLDCDAKTIHDMFRIFHENELWLAQPSLTTDSYYSHAITLRKQGLLLRYTNFVEIMAPIFSQQALLQCLSTFNMTQSGWGLELAWPKILGDPADKIAILDAVSIRHTRTLGSGTLYKVISAVPESEWYLMAGKYNVPLPYEFRTYKEVQQQEHTTENQKCQAVNSKYTPKVSVIMSVHNAQDYLSQAIDSILTQTFTDFEFIIIDDGSTDNSLNIINAYKDLRINLLRNETKLGQAASLDKGINEAKGMYIVHMDADVISKPERLVRQVEFMDCHPNIGVCGSWVETFGECTEAVWSYPVDIDMVKCFLLFRTVVAHPAVIIRKNILITEGFCYSNLYRHDEDYNLWIKIARKYDITNIPEVLLKQRISSNQINSEFKQQRLEATAKLHLEQINALGIKPTQQEYLLHQAISLGALPSSDTPIEAVLQWFTKLKEANMVSCYYPEPAFTQVLRQYWVTICQAVSGR